MAAGLVIHGTGSAVPQRVVSNDDMAQLVDTSDEWIRERTGIRERRHAVDETVLSLATEAAQAALQQTANLDALNQNDAPPISHVICATVTSELRCPSLACLLQRDLKLPSNIFAFDLNAACCGWLYAFIVARGLLKPGERALVVGGEKLTKITNFEDRNTCILFGDAAGAAVVEGTDSKRFFCTTQANGCEEALRIENKIEMDGPIVFKFAVGVLMDSIGNVLAQADCTPNQIDHFIVHQANARIIASTAKRLGIPMERFFMNIEKYGNTSAASIPLALDEAVRNGLLRPGNKVVFAGFGGGLTSGAVYMEW
jgi:3-oxoacyl-[acyl-carrier-protein] synthase-3